MKPITKERRIKILCYFLKNIFMFLASMAIMVILFIVFFEAEFCETPLSKFMYPQEKTVIRCIITTVIYIIEFVVFYIAINQLQLSAEKIMKMIIKLIKRRIKYKIRQIKYDTYQKQVREELREVLQDLIPQK